MMISHLFRKRAIYLPTWKLTLVLVLLLAGILVGLVRSLYPFLAQSEPVDRSDVIVIDGWVSDQTMEVAIAIAREQSCELMLSAGVGLSAGYYLSQYKSFAELGEATLEALGVPADQVHSAPAGTNQRHRTFASAVAVYQWLEKEDHLDARVPVITEGPHSRRSLAVYRKVFRETEAEIGIISGPPPAFDPEAWWKTNFGMKTVIVEFVAVTDEWLRDSGRSSNDPHSIQTGITGTPYSIPHPPGR